MMCTHWKDKEDVYMLSTCVEEGETEVMRAGKPKHIPNVVHIYNNSMGSVDRNDQMLTSYLAERKRVKKYKKYFYHLLNQSVLNAFIISQKKGNKKNSLKFREQLTEKLFQMYCTAESKPQTQGHLSRNNVVQLVERYFPKMIPSNAIKPNPSRRCAVCSANKIRKGTRYYCKDCDVGVCVVRCFEYYHTKYDHKNVFE